MALSPALPPNLMVMVGDDGKIFFACCVAMLLVIAVFLAAPHKKCGEILGARAPAVPARPEF